MSIQITQEVAQLVQTIFQEGGFVDETEALTEALRTYRRRQELIAKVQVGVEQLNRGEGIPAADVLDRLQRKAEQLASRGDS
jgi:Arc/MetJ-type ribon-helix-helix transcriptional regulator